MFNCQVEVAPDTVLWTYSTCSLVACEDPGLMNERDEVETWYTH